MKPILISSCHNCDPETWVVEGDSKYEYKCSSCGRVIKKILKRRNSEDESSR